MELIEIDPAARRFDGSGVVAIGREGNGETSEHLTGFETEALGDGAGPVFEIRGVPNREGAKEVATIESDRAAQRLDASLADLVRIVIVLTGFCDRGIEPVDVTSISRCQPNPVAVSTHCVRSHTRTQSRERAAQGRPGTIRGGIGPKQTGQDIAIDCAFDGEVRQHGDGLPGVHVDGGAVDSDHWRAQQLNIEQKSSDRRG
jgi:hypothetical protein